MSDAPVPLSRFRAALARPAGKKRVDALLASDHAEAEVQALSVPELYFLIKDVGLVDCYDLAALATPEQMRGCVDLDAWDRDQPQLEAVRHWLAAASDVGFERLGDIWRGLDAELCALLLSRSVVIYDHSLGEAPGDDVDTPLFETPDTFFTLGVSGSEDEVVWILSLVADLYRADADLARRTIMAARSEPIAELEEYAYRWRSGRMADLGYVEFYDALEAFRPIDPDSVIVGENTSRDMAHDPSETPSTLPAPMIGGVVGQAFLARALDKIQDPDEIQRLEEGLLILVNRVLSAARVAPGDEGALEVGTQHAMATLALGLEAVSSGDLDRAAQALSSISLLRLHRVGYSMTLRLSRLARTLAPKSRAAGAVTQSVLAAALRRRPFFPLALEEAGNDEVRPFESTLDLQRVATHLAELTFRLAIASAVGVDAVALGEAPEPRADLDDYLRTAVVRALAGGELDAAPLGPEELAEIRATVFPGGAIADDKRTSAAKAVAEALDREQVIIGREHLPRLLQRWFDDLRSELGELAADADLRFVGGVILTGARS